MIEFDKTSHLMAPSVRIAVLGIGGAGNNTVNTLLQLHALYDQLTCIAINTDLKALDVSNAPVKVQIGIKSTKGLGAGANPEIGKRAAEEDLAEVLEAVKDVDIVFLTGGLGGGTGSGALPVIARALRERDTLSVAVVTKPFAFEGSRRMRIAQEAEVLLRKEVDTLIVIPNERLLLSTDQKISLVSAFEQVNSLIGQLVKSIADIISKPGYINVDFADIKAIMKGKGLAVMGTGCAQGSERAVVAARAAVESPLLDQLSIKGARSVLVNITGSADLGLQEVSEAASLITGEAHEDATIIIGSVIDPTMADEVSVTVIATGFAEQQPFMEPLINEKRFEEAPAMTAHPLKELLISSKPSSVMDKPDELEVPTLLRKMVREKLQQQGK